MFDSDFKITWKPSLDFCYLASREMKLFSFFNLNEIELFYRKF